MKLHYAIPNLGQLRRELLAVVEAHSASNGIDDERAWRDAFVCFVKEMLADRGYSLDHLKMLVTLVDDLGITKGD